MYLLWPLKPRFATLCTCLNSCPLKMAGGRIFPASIISTSPVIIRAGCYLLFGLICALILWLVGVLGVRTSIFNACAPGQLQKLGWTWGGGPQSHYSRERIGCADGAPAFCIHRVLRRRGEESEECRTLRNPETHSRFLHPP